MTTELEEVEGLGHSKEKNVWSWAKSHELDTSAQSFFWHCHYCTEASPPPAAKHALRGGPGRHEQYALLPLPAAAAVRRARAELSKHSNSTGAITTDKTRENS